MKNKQNLKDLIKKRNKRMDEISKDIRELETLLKSSTFMSFKSKVFSEGFHLYWNSETKRLCMQNFEDEVSLPLIETPADIREALHKHLDEFIEELIKKEKNNGNQ